VASPHLWTTIFFDGGEDEEARIHMFAHLSQDLPLYVIHLYSRDGKSMERFINNYRLRIQSIEDDLEYEYRGGVDLSAILDTITTSLPALRYLESHSDSISEGFLLNCVNLRVLEWPRIMIADEACLGSHVESVRFDDVDPSKITTLTHRTNIRRLELDLHYKDYLLLWDEKPSDAFGTHMANLFTKIGHILSNLGLNISFHSYSTFIPLLSSIPGLHTLSLQLTITESLNDLPQLSPPRIRHSDIQAVRVLYIEVSEATLEDSDLELEPQSADALIWSWTAEHPLRELEIFDLLCSVSCHEDHIIPLLQSAVGAHLIRASSINNMISTSLRIERRFMPRLQSLELPSLRLYNCIDAPNLLQLTLTSDATEDLVPLEMDATMDLQRLTVPTPVMDYVGISCKSSWNCKAIKFSSDRCPREITLLSRLERVEFPRGEMAENHFLLKMLENPEACPRLHTIAIAGYPLWELLFEVLRKRNSSGVQRIARITLPRLPVLQLLWRLVRLLSGEKFVFTNRDVDEVIAKRIACPQM
jgi:hypothetical protein